MAHQKLDPQLVFLQEQDAQVLERLAEAGLSALEAVEDPADARISAFVQYDGDLDALAGAGLEIRTVAGDVVTGYIPVAGLDALAGADGVKLVEGSRPLVPELDLATVESRATVVQTGPPGHRGAGVIVGICDTGVDWRHENFRRADGTAQVIGIWDQSLTPQAGEANPAGFSYGVEYTGAHVAAALAGTGTVRHADGSGHGTHVAGIAAGDGSAAGQSRPAGTFVGVAPEADIMVVAVGGGGGRGLGDSARALDAVAYVFQRAAALNRPAVVNMSLGDNVGPHDGTSLLERGLNNLLGGQGRAFVKSAGNAGAGGVHAQGTVAPGGTQAVSFVVTPNDASTETIDIWYEGADRFTFAITEPGGPASTTVAPNSTTTLTLGNGNRVFVDSRTGDPNNGDNRIFLTIERGTAQFIESGTWRLTLTGTQVTNGRFDAWIQRGDQIASFIAPHESRRMTISTPGTATKVITVANYVTRGGGVGSISGSSSQGPTRDGRAMPDVAAPGQIIISARSNAGGADPYVGMGGTSMAAPHVTGAIALLFQKNRNLTQQQIKDCLRNRARADAFTGTTPNDQWGAGKLDVAAAFDCVPGPIVRTRTPDCLIGTRTPDCVIGTRIGCRTRTPDCVIGTRIGCPTRTPDCVFGTRFGCPTRGPGCLLSSRSCPINPIDPAGPKGGGRTVIGQEDPESGALTWFAYDPYGELEAISEDGEHWTDIDEDES